jgi:hypothetical protein
MFYWFEPVLYLVPISKYPGAIKRLGYLAGFVDNVGDTLLLKILKMTWSQFFIVWMRQIHFQIIG